MSFETKAVRTGVGNSLHQEHSSSIYVTSSFTFGSSEEARAKFSEEVDGSIYSRYSNPNTDEFIAKLCALEGAEDGVSTATGMSAMFTSMGALLSTGDHILASRALFGATHQLLTKILPKWGIESTLFNLHRPEKIAELIQPNTKMIFVETPSNPGLDLIDLEYLSSLAKKHNILLNVDNCFATPYAQRPLEFGADLVTHSATKFIDGQGRTLGGAVLGRKELIDEVRFFARNTGPSLSPFNAWVLSKSLETLPVRMEKHCENALKLARYLENHEELERVRYPFLESHPQYDLARKQMSLGGGVITFTVKGGYERAASFLDNLKMSSITANLGDTRTIVMHPASTTHSKLTEEERAAVGISPGLIRVSVGLENINDIAEDIENALQASKEIVENLV